MLTSKAFYFLRLSWAQPAVSVGTGCLPYIPVGSVLYSPRFGRRCQKQKEALRRLVAVCNS